MNRKDFKKLDQLCRMARRNEARELILANHPDLWWTVEDGGTLDSQMRMHGRVCWSRLHHKSAVALYREDAVGALDRAMRYTVCGLGTRFVQILRDSMVKSSHRSLAKARAARLRYEKMQRAEIDAQMNDAAWGMYGYAEEDYYVQ